MRLALGTVQFGLAYGVAGRAQAVPETEVRAILTHAWSAGIRVLDTAPTYGDIESRLTTVMSHHDFDVVSKVGPIDASDAQTAARLVHASIERSKVRLGSKLKTILFHRDADLSGPHGEAAWCAAERAASGSIRLGVSCYEPESAARLRRRYPVDVVQLPANALDQRLVSVGDALDGVEIHVRSAFLQGLLLMPVADAVARVPAASDALMHWRAWCEGRNLRPISAALGIVRSLPGVQLVVVGVDRLEQLQDILSAWQDAEPGSAPSLACQSIDVIDPRRWAPASARH